MFLKILVPLDGSDTAECVLPHVKLLASADKNVTIDFIYVVAPLDAPMIDAKYRIKIETESRQAAADYLKRLITKSGLKEIARPIVAPGKVADTISDYAARNKQDLIIMATWPLRGEPLVLWQCSRQGSTRIPHACLAGQGRQQL